MTWENITLLAVGFSLLGLNALLGSRAAEAIARFFVFLGPGASAGRPSEPTPEESPEPSLHSASGVRLSAGNEADATERPLARNVGGIGR